MATVGSAIVCDRLRLYGNMSLCDPRSSVIVCDHMETNLKTSKVCACTEGRKNGYYEIYICYAFFLACVTIRTNFLNWFAVRAVWNALQTQISVTNMVSNLIESGLE